MEVMMPSNNIDFNFINSAAAWSNSPPCTPKGFGKHYSFSAPTSPAHLSHFYRDSDEFTGGSSASTPPQESEENPMTPESVTVLDNVNGDDFSFDTIVSKDNYSEPGDKLFDGDCVIKPSLSPVRDNQQHPWEEETHDQLHNAKNDSSSSVGSILSSSSVKGRDKKKWRLMDFFVLFRSASEGRASNKDPLRKYTADFQRTDSSRSGPGSKRGGPVSAHELHYMVNRAVSEDMKKKTFLPYKQGILSRLF